MSHVYCPIKMDDNAPATVGVYINYSKVDTMECWLKANHWAGLPKINLSIAIPSGVQKSVYQTIDTGSWWSVTVDCYLGNEDKIHSFNYKAL